MAITDKKISVIYPGRDISSLSDRPNQDGMTATQLKARFDQLGKEVIPKINDLIDELFADLYSGAEQIGHTHNLDNIVDGITYKLFTAFERAKLVAIAEGAEVNQNAFGNVKVGSTTIASTTKTDTFELVAGLNVSIAVDALTKKITLSATGDLATEAVQSYIEDIGNYFTSLNVEGALQEIGANITEVKSQLAHNETAIEELTTVTDSIVLLESFPIIIPEVDDTNRIQRAIDYAQENSGILTVQSGKKYNFSNTLKISKSIRIIGQKGRAMYKSTMFKYTGTGVAVEIFNGNLTNATTLWGVTLENISIYKDFTGDYGTEGIGIRCHQISECKFDSVQITGFKANLELTGSNIVTFSHCVFNHCEYSLTISNRSFYDTFVSTQANNHIIISDCNFWSARIAHVTVNNVDNLHISHTHMEKTPICILVDTAYGYQNTSFIRNMTVRDSNFRGWDFANFGYGITPRLLYVTGTGLINAGNVVFDGMQVMFLPSTNPNTLGQLPSYAIECDMPHASSIFRMTAKNITSFGVQTCFAYGNTTKFDAFFWDYLIVKSGVDGTGLTVPLNDPMRNIAKGIIRNGNLIQINNNLKLNDGNTGGTLAGELWYTSKQLRYHDGTNAKIIAIVSIGTTVQRPTGVTAGFQFYDTTLNKPIWWNGINWVDATGTTV